MIYIGLGFILENLLSFYSKDIRHSGLFGKRGEVRVTFILLDMSLDSSSRALLVKNKKGKVIFK
jgi:hypothetical protein